MNSGSYPSVLITTLGCKLNQLESEAYTDSFIKAGFVLHNDSTDTPPSVIIVNTCTVTSKADQKARRVIRKALRDYPEAAVIVTGCYAQLEGDLLKRLEQKTPREGAKAQRLSIMKKEELLQSSCLPTPHSPLPTPQQDAFQFSPEKFSSHTRSLLKIQDGCDNHCTYCRIRLARGKSISLDARTVLERLLVLEQNHAEAVLTGVNICQYYDKTIKNLNNLLEYLLSNTKKIAIRLSSLSPQSIDENFAKVLSHKRIRPHFHLSIQSCSEKVLQRMGRSYNAGTIEKAVTLLRGAKSDPFIACDIITGFPGESEEDFNETFKLCKKMDFAWIHVFPFSKRKGTPAFGFADTVQESEVTRRVRLLTDLAWQGKREYVRRWIGKEVEALVEKSGGKTGIRATVRAVSENYLKVLVRYKGTSPPPGTVLRCRLLEESVNPKDYDVVGEKICVV